MRLLSVPAAFNVDVDPLRARKLRLRAEAPINTALHDALGTVDQSTATGRSVRRLGRRASGTPCRSPCRTSDTAWREAGGAKANEEAALFLPRTAGVHATPRRASASSADRGARRSGPALGSDRELRAAARRSRGGVRRRTRTRKPRSSTSDCLAATSPYRHRHRTTCRLSTTSFVGRRRLLTELTAGLVRTRLLTLTGVGGVGKSRLALELARLSRRRPPTSQTGSGSSNWLESKMRRSFHSTVASALRVILPGGPDPNDDARRTTRIADAAADHRQLRTPSSNACSALIQQVLTRCPRHQYRHHQPRTPRTSWRAGLPRALARAAALTFLESGCRQVFRLEAVQLFVERAWLTAPTFKLDANTAGTPSPRSVIGLRRHNRSLLSLPPLALAHFTVNELADRLGDALSLLGQRQRGRFDRQQNARSNP